MTIPSHAVKKFTKRLNQSAANMHIFQFVAQGLFLHSTRNLNSLGPIYSSIMTNQTTSGLERQIGPIFGTIFGHWSRPGPSPEIGTFSEALFSRNISEISLCA